MRPRSVTERDREIFPGRRTVFRCPPGIEDCEPAEVIQDETCIRIPWTLEDEDLDAIENGDQVTVWLTIFGNGMPPVDLQVVSEEEQDPYPPGPPAAPTPPPGRKVG